MREVIHHVSSAIVVVRPERTEEIAVRLLHLDGVEVHASTPGKIVVVIEGSHSGALGETLISISSMDGVLAAHMVFEQALDKEDASDDDRHHAA